MQLHGITCYLLNNAGKNDGAAIRNRGATDITMLIVNEVLILGAIHWYFAGTREI